ncbi:hypothetical protein ACH4UT_28020 [Streptomyces sp. NPDC020799]|uniref:hypothetical protein n=1 Tax=Streptomyces sp. NPDC020799 TaxID=3365091 RepID=UPI00378F2E9C
MTTTDARVRAPVLGVLLEELRAAQPGPALAEQRHQFLDLDPDLVREDYTRPAVPGGAGYERGEQGGAVQWGEGG